MVNFIVLCLLGILLLSRAITHGVRTRMQETKWGKEFPQGRDAHARSPWNAFPDYYL